MRFPNKAGDHADTDAILRAELKAAGIQTMQEAEGKPPEYLADLLRRNSGEVKTSVIGVLHGWTFKRAWYYWMCSGPGIEVEAAERLHAAHGRDVRVDGHGGCPSPREWFKGLACGSYHVDTPEGLKALADTIKGLASPPGTKAPSPRPGQIWRFNDTHGGDQTAVVVGQAGIGVWELKTFNSHQFADGMRWMSGRERLFMDEDFNRDGVEFVGELPHRTNPSQG